MDLNKKVYKLKNPFKKKKMVDKVKLTNPRLVQLERDLGKNKKAREFLEKEKKKLILEKEKILLKIKKEKEVLRLKNRIKTVRKKKS